MGKLKCIACGKEYEYCHACGDYNPYDLWKYKYCSDNCRNLFRVVADYNHGSIPKEEAVLQFRNLDLSYLSRMIPAIVKSVKEVFGGSLDA